MARRIPRKLSTETLEARRCMAASIFGDDMLGSVVHEVASMVRHLQLHNLANPTDVNADGNNDPQDALAVINELNRASASGEAGSGSGLLCDTNGDDSVTPADAITVINELNSSEAALSSYKEADPSSLVPDDTVVADPIEDSVESSTDEVVVVDDTIDEVSADENATDENATDEEVDGDCVHGRIGNAGSLFDRTDANEDGTVAADEVPELESIRPKTVHGLRRGLEALFARADDNNDGILTEDEVPSVLWEHLLDADTNASGDITLEEITAYRAAAKDRVFEEFDANDDGLVTSDEVSGRIWERLARADADESDSVSLEELKAFHESHSSPRQIVRNVLNHVSSVIQQVATNFGRHWRR